MIYELILIASNLNLWPLRINSNLHSRVFTINSGYAIVLFLKLRLIVTVNPYYNENGISSYNNS